MALPQRVFVAPYINLSYDHLSHDQQVERVQGRVNLIANKLAELNERSHNRLFNDAVILHSSRPPSALIAQKLAEAVPARTRASERAYVMGDHPAVVDAPRGWLLKAAQQAAGDDWEGSPIIALVPSAAVSYIDGTYNPLDFRMQTSIPEPLIEITDETNWPVDAHQAELAQAFFRSEADQAQYLPSQL